MESTKFLDAIARMPGNNAEDADAFSAYTQVDLDELSKLLGKSASKDLITETWISGKSIPRHRRPPSWDKIEEPMVRLKVNLYGHPLAGLIWEKHCQHYILQAGFEKIPGWGMFVCTQKAKAFLKCIRRRL